MYKSEDRLAEWRNKFASATMTYLDKYFPDLDLDAEERALHAMWLLGTDNKTCPYYYRVYEEGETPAVSAHKCCVPALTFVFQGIFQSEMVSTVLAAHTTMISSIPPKLRSKENPHGALVLSLQAVSVASNVYLFTS